MPAFCRQNINQAGYVLKDAKCDQKDSIDCRRDDTDDLLTKNIGAVMVTKIPAACREEPDSKEVTVTKVYA